MKSLSVGDPDGGGRPTRRRKFFSKCFGRKEDEEVNLGRKEEKGAIFNKVKVNFDI